MKPHWKEEKIIIQGKIMNCKELVKILPIHYEILKEFHGINGFFLFTVFIKNVKILTKHLIAEALYKNLIIKIMHSEKMSGLFVKDKKMILFGNFQNGILSFPKILSKNPLIEKPQEEILIPIYENKMKIDYHFKKIKNQSEFSLLLDRIHNPINLQDVNEALKTLFTMELAWIFHKLKQNKEKKEPLNIKTFQDFPFSLREEQKKAIKEITENLMLPYINSHLLFGEVGSGKTAVAISIAIGVIKENKNVLFLVPTQLLAHQIYENILKYTENVTLITGKTKKNIIKPIPQIYIGTQALLFRQFENVGLVIIDEQHRFGVNQRKLARADLLMMTATPIPRTFEMILNGHMGLSKLMGTESKTQTLIFKNNKKYHLVEKMKNLKLVWICKTIEDLESFSKELKKKFIDTQILHSKIKNKQEILDNFDQNGGWLLATTVLEVGIDIHIDYIIIEKADTYGLAQLHQLRGRVGRRDTNAFCFLLGESLKKMEEIRQCINGFSLSELDYKKRGSGEIFGTNQSGFKNFIFNEQYLIEGHKAQKIILNPTEEIIEQSKIREVNNVFDLLLDLSE